MSAFEELYTPMRSRKIHLYVGSYDRKDFESTDVAVRAFFSHLILNQISKLK